MPSDRSGFSAFELLYGRRVRGPLTVLRDLWENKSTESEERSCFQYVIELQSKLEHCSRIAAQNAAVSVNRFKHYFDLKSQNRQFKKDDEVLVLLPDTRKKLLMAWSGPFKVLERRNRVNYVIEEKGKPKLYHINLLKQYHRRHGTNLVFLADEVPTLDIHPVGDAFFVTQHCAVIDQSEQDPTSNSWLDFNHAKLPFPKQELKSEPVSNPFPIDCVEITRGETPDVCSDLENYQLQSLNEVLKKYSEVFSEIPGCTNTVVHDVELITSECLRSKMYPVPIHLKPHFEAEVDKLATLGIIQPSTSHFCSPVVMVKKTDSSYRLTLDFRYLNSLTVFRAEPCGTIDEDLYKFSGAKYFSEIDITKAYYQIKLTERTRKLTAFQTQRGLMEFTRLPFGMVTACATYISLMRIVLAGIQNVSFYFDNIFIFSASWSDHVVALETTLARLREHGLTARPSKCRFGYPEINYLGFIVGRDILKLQPEKVKAILDLNPPSTKKTLRSFLGMVSFYRKFLPDVASLSSPLSNLLKKSLESLFCGTKPVEMLLVR
jgi:hypothetical protein